MSGFHTTTYTAILYASSTLKMSPSKIIIIGVLVQLAAVISSILAPIVQKRLAISNQRLLLWVILLAEIIPIYACIGLVLPFGGLRTEGEMYVAATWFGLVSYADTSTDDELMHSYTVRSRAIVELSMRNSSHLYAHLTIFSINN
jgi:MFS-type transporter involved in bile tolerance (Atg22 family)